MELERTIKRKGAPEPSNDLEFQSYAVKTLYLEDLIQIHQQVEVIARPSAEFRQRMIQHNVEMNELIHQEERRIAKELPKRDLDSFWERPDILMSSEEFEFRDFDEITVVERGGFSEFTIMVVSPSFHFRIGKSLTLMGLFRPSEESKAAFEQIVEVLRKRENKALKRITESDFLVWWFYGLVIAGAITLFTRNTFAIAALSALLLIGLGIVAWYAFVWRRRRFVVVPRFKHRVEELERPQKLGVWSIVIGLLGVFVAIMIAVLD